MPSIHVSSADVLCGRDKHAFGHEGNNYFRDLIQAHREGYQGSRRRADKNAITRKVIGLVEDRRGRFLKLGPDNEWSVMADPLVYEKVSHALRGAKSPVAAAAALTSRPGGVRSRPPAVSAPRRAALPPSLQQRQEEVSAQQRAFFEMLVRNDRQRQTIDDGLNVVSDSSFSDDDASQAGGGSGWDDVPPFALGGCCDLANPDPAEFQLLSSESLAFDLPTVGV